MRIPLPRRRIRPRTAWITLLTLGFAALVVLPEAVTASGLNAVHRPPTVPSGLDARRAVVLRPNRVDLVDGRTVIASMPYDGTNSSLGELASAIGAPSYLARYRSTVIVKAAVVQRPGTQLTVGGRDGVRTVLVRSTRDERAYFWGTGARLTLDHVTLRGTPVRPAARGYLRYSGSSTVTVRDSLLTNLGRPGPHRIGALDIGRGARATVTGTTIRNVDTGIVAHDTLAVFLQHVTVTGAAADGIALLDAGTVDAAVLKLVGNKRNGLVVSGTATRTRTLRDVMASKNGHAGLMVTGGAAPVVVRLRTDHNGNAGAVLRGAGRTRLVDGTSAAEPTGVRVQDGRPATVTGLTATGDGTGVSTDGKAAGILVRGARIIGAKVGVRVQTPGARVERLTLHDTEIGIESGPGARRLKVTGLSASARSSGSGTGVVVGGPGADLTDVHVSGSRTGLRIEGPDAVVTRSTVDAAGSGVLLSGTATGAGLDGVRIFGTEEGMRISAGADGARLVDTTVGGGSGLRIGAGDVTVNGGSLQGQASAVVVDGGAGAVNLSGAEVRGAVEGIRVAAQAGDVSLDGVRVTGSSRNALQLDGGITVVHGSTLQSAGTVVDAGAELRLDGSTVTGPVGVRIAPGVTGTLADTQVQGRDVGILAVPGSHVTLTASKVYGAVPVRGSATIRDHSFVAAMPMNWLGVAGIALVVIAVLLMLAARVRERGQDRVSLAPAHVVNRA
ncbi:MAG TPA: hypothetical protein VEV65_07645 [Kineosporiaceae bacterium]|nr:hypothetical protein [Kineosporiaceae bacterium]